MIAIVRHDALEPLDHRIGIAPGRKRGDGKSELRFRRVGHRGPLAFKRDAIIAQLVQRGTVGAEDALQNERGKKVRAVEAGQPHADRC